MTYIPADAEEARSRLARVPAMATTDLLDVVGVLAGRLREREAEIVADLAGMMAREIDQLDTDPKLVEMLEASVHGNVSTIIHVLANDIPVDHLQPTTAAVEYARRLAQRDVPSNSLVRAYHLGQNSVMLLCYSIIEELGLDATQAMAVTRHVSDVMFGYIDWITLFVFEAYEDERRRWLGADAHVVSAAIRRVLDRTDVDPTAFETETRYRLDRTHLGGIMWTDDADAHTLGRLDRVTRELAACLGSDGPPLVMAVDRSTIWLWIPLRARTTVIEESLSPSVLPEGVRLAVGLPGHGVGGFRRTHEQASAAYSVATMPGTADRAVVGFADRGVAVVSLLAQDPDGTRSWVHDVLGSLAEDTPSAAVLRDTLSVYFATKESHLHTATRLNLHRNTVKYRVGKALSEVGPDRDRLDLALALTACDLLGPMVLNPAAGGSGPRVAPARHPGVVGGA
ncbi:helix-turn-helix domain-containing protein [Gordonia sp. VNQ95]|jgi:hypothetical protein|uniref:PucR family transcriptional regulator n=1 Tax=Gordonia sp. VNQ95 TaxID=3156619 RepID=UPI0032B5A876